MRRRFGAPLLLVLLLVSFAFIGLTLVTVHLVGADPGSYQSHPTAHYEYGGIGVTDPALAHDEDNSTCATFNYKQDPPCAFEVNTFPTPPVNYSISSVDFKMNYSAEDSSAKAAYQFSYYVDPSSTQTILQAWTSTPRATPSVDVWSDQPEPNDGTWNWTDISNIRFLVETDKISGGGSADFEEYEAWVTVNVGPKPSPEMYVKPPSIIDYDLTPESTVTIRPNADSASSTYQTWTGTYTDWDEATQNGDTDYVSATTYGKLESSQLENPTHPSWEIARVRVVAYARTNITTNEELVLMLVIGGTEYWADYPAYPKPGYTLTTTYEKYTWDWGKNPDTGDYWTWSDIDALEAGVESQVSSDYVWTGEIRVTQLYVEIDGPRLTVDIEVSNVEDLWGYTVFLSYDTSILTGTSYITYNPFTYTWPSEINDEITSVTGEDVGTGDEETTEFYTESRPVVSSSDTVYLDDVAQTRGVDYTIDYKAGKITFTSPPEIGVAITADYEYIAYVSVTYSKPMGSPGVDTGLPTFCMPLVEIAFLVEGVGSTDLDLHDTKLSDRNGDPISHDVVSGYFENQEAVPEFPFGMAIELSLVVAIVYLWWRRRKKLTWSHQPL